MDNKLICLIKQEILFFLYRDCCNSDNQMSNVFIISSTSATLEIYHVDIANNELDMPVIGSLNTEQR